MAELPLEQQQGKRHLEKPRQSGQGPRNEKLWSSRAGLFEIHRSSSESGLAVYCGKVIAPIADIPLVLTMNRTYAPMERALTEQNAHRLNTPLDIFGRLFASRGMNDDLEAERLIVEVSQPLWTEGHPLIRVVAVVCHPYHDSYWPASLAEKVFKGQYFTSSLTRCCFLQAKYARLEHQWEQEGKHRLPWYFSGFGVLNASRHFELRQEGGKDESINCRGRRPTEAQLEYLKVLEAGLQLLDPELASVVQHVGVGHRIVNSECLAGMLRTRKDKPQPVVYLSKKLFLKPYPEALAVFVHEHAHLTGSDGSREFTDALTAMLATSLQRRDKFPPLEAEWDRLRSRAQCP